MTQEEIEELVGKKLDSNSFTLEKKIYNGILYFYLRELKQDHYFYVPVHNKLYLIKHHSDNYNPSVTETANKPDSFKFKFDDMLELGRIEVVNGIVRQNLANKSIDSQGNKEEELANKIDNIIIELTRIRAELLK